MTREDVTRLLAYIQSFDKRTVGEADALAWYDILPQDISYEAYRAAIRKHYQQTTKMMMPAELIQLAKLERPVQDKLYGQPGEILCKKCSGVHYPHEDCSVLVPMPANFREQVKALTGVDPANLFKLPADVEDLSGF